MPKILILNGLPASGKSTHAKKLVDSGGWKRINKDDLRAMLDNSHWSHDNEKAVVELRNYIIIKFLDLGYNVVVDDTNVNPRHIRDIQMIPMLSSNPRVASAEVEVKFFDVDVEECIRRDKERAKNPKEVSVGEDVIRKLHHQLKTLKPRPLPKQNQPAVPYTKPKNKPKAIICDIDGTLAHMNGKRGPFDWHKVGVDDLDETVAGIIRHYAVRDIGEEDYTHIIMLSGRDGVCRPETEQWLFENNIPYDHLFMRTKDDNRKDSIIKLELFDEHIRNDYQVEFVLDDRNQVVEMWRNLGLKVLQVAEGNF